MKERRQELFVEGKGILTFVPQYGRPQEIRTWYFTLPGQEHVPGRYTLRWRQYSNGEGFLQIKKNPYKFKLRCSLAEAENIFALQSHTGNAEADQILHSIGSTSIVFALSSTRQHWCEGTLEQVRVTHDGNIMVYSPSGNCLGSLPDRYECKIYGEIPIDEILSLHGLVKTESETNKRIQAFRIVDQVRLDAFKLLPGREVEIKFDSLLGYQATVLVLKALDLSEIKFIWQSFEHVEQNTHVYYRSVGGAYREIFRNGGLQAIVRKTDRQDLNREEALCESLPSDAVLLGAIDRRKFKAYIVDTITGHCFQLAVDEAVRHCDGEVMVQIEAEYIRSIYPWSDEASIFESLNRLNELLTQQLISKAVPTKRRKVDFITE